MACVANGTQLHHRLYRFLDWHSAAVSRRAKEMASLRKRTWRAAVGATWKKLQGLTSLGGTGAGRAGEVGDDGWRRMWLWAKLWTRKRLRGNPRRNSSSDGNAEVPEEAIRREIQEEQDAWARILRAAHEVLQEHDLEYSVSSEREEAQVQEAQEGEAPVQSQEDAQETEPFVGAQNRKYSMITRTEEPPRPATPFFDASALFTVTITFGDRVGGFRRTVLPPRELHPRMGMFSTPTTALKAARRVFRRACPPRGRFSFRSIPQELIEEAAALIYVVVSRPAGYSRLHDFLSLNFNFQIVHMIDVPGGEPTGSAGRLEWNVRRFLAGYGMLHLIPYSTYISLAQSDAAGSIAPYTVFVHRIRPT
ncbi:uncharacterized protein LOC144710663 [Wolffia australiana]